MQRLSIIYRYGSLIAIGALFFVMYWLHPSLCDDYRFSQPMADFFADRTVGSFFNCWLTSLSECFYYDNGRIAQLLSPVLVSLPRVIVAAVLAFATLVCIVYSARLAGVWNRHPLLFALLVAVWVFAMPWADYMFGIMFASNYILPAALMLYTLWLFMNTRVSMVSAALLGILIGCSHELYCSAMIAVVAVSVVFVKEFRDRSTIVLFGALCVSLLYLYCVPGTAVRTGARVIFEGLKNPLASAYWGCLYYAYLLVALIAFLIPAWRIRIDRRLLLVCLTGATAGWLIWRVFLGGLRLTWCLDIFSTIGLVSLFASVPTGCRINPKHSIATALALVAVCVAHLALCIPWFVTMNREVREVRFLRTASIGRCVFYDMTEVHTVPPYTLGKPNFNIYNSEWHDLDYVVPEKLRTFRPEHAVCVGSDLYMYEGCLVHVYTGQSAMKNVALHYDYGTSSDTRMGSARRFTADDGREYLYLCPYYRSLRKSDTEPVSVSVEF